MSFGIGSVLNAAHSKKKTKKARKPKINPHKELRGRDGKFHSRTNRAGLTTAGTKKERFLYFGGQKIGELGAGVALGAMQAYGDPLFGSDDPAKAIGPKLIGSVVFNVIEAAQLFFGWSFSKVLGATAGTVVDGAVAGGGSACWSIFVFDNANTYFAAKIDQASGSAASKGLDYTEERRQLHAPSRSASQVAAELPPAHVGGENAARLAAQNVRQAEFASRMNAAQGVAEQVRKNPMFRHSFD